MNFAKSWVLTVEDMTYTIDYDPRTLSGRKVVIINGMPVNLKLTFFTRYAGLDQTIGVGGKKANFVLINGKADLAVDGYYLDSKKEYIPLLGVPKWVWIFVLACAAIPIYTLGGAIPALIGFSGIMICIKLSVSRKLNTLMRVLLCALITGISWILLILFIQTMLSLV